MSHIAIIGTGLIGGSLGLALHAARAGHQIVGHDRDPEVAAKARRRGAVDKAEWNLPAAVDDAGLVIIAVPPDAIRQVFAAIAPHLGEGAAVTDTASVKEPIVRWAGELLPEHVSFVGGHPMTGKESGGIENAAADLFAGRTYCLTPTAETSGQAIELAGDLAKAVRARPLFLEPAEHDGLVAGVSHLPFLVASALAHATTRDPAWREAAPLAAGGFTDTTRLASGDPAMHRTICQLNRTAILRWLDRYQAELAALRNTIASEKADEQLEALLRETKEARDRWLRAPVPDKDDSVPSPGDQVRRMFFGGMRRRDRR